MPQELKRVLIVDDVELNCTLLSFELTDAGFDVVSAFSGEAALDLLQTQTFDIILLDIEMPGIGGMETLNRLKADEHLNQIPVIMITAIENDQSIEACLDLGAHDYLSKPVTSRELHARIRSALRFAGMLLKLRSAKIALEESNTELHRLATTDPLTECFNRRHFFDLSNREYSRAVRYAGQFAVVMIDIDHFKSVNDNYGHSVGDSVIKWVSELCKKSVRITDIVGRLGGEEFAICCPGVRTEGALVVAERIRRTCMEHSMVEGESVFNVTVSIGVTEYTAADEDFAAVLERADALLYQAKVSGRNNCQSILTAKKA